MNLSALPIEVPFSTSLFYNQWLSLRCDAMADLHYSKKNGGDTDFFRKEIERLDYYYPQHLEDLRSRNMVASFK